MKTIRDARRPLRWLTMVLAVSLAAVRCGNGHDQNADTQAPDALPDLGTTDPDQANDLADAQDSGEIRIPDALPDQESTGPDQTMDLADFHDSGKPDLRPESSDAADAFGDDSAPDDAQADVPLFPDAADDEETARDGVPDESLGPCDPAAELEGTPCLDGTGVCQAGSCWPFAHRLPATGDWVATGVGPQTPQPPGCGSALAPCNQGQFTFRWPADSGLTTCADGMATIFCPLLATSESCATTPLCGQDAQYGWDLTNPSWDTARYRPSGIPQQPTVEDLWTGLIWQAEALQNRTWQQAVGDCANLGEFGGLSGWHLPDEYQLMSLVDQGLSDPASSFPGQLAVHFWTSATATSHPDRAFYVDFELGNVGYGEDKQLGYAVRCVTQPVAAALPDYRYFASEPHAGQRLVFDTRTGLLWQASHTGEKRWPEALAYCEGLEYAGRSDWRLPNIFELRSLVDNTREQPALDPVAFAQTDPTWFWSSTTYPTGDRKPWYVFFGNGHTYFYDGNLATAARCVTLGP